MKAIILFVAMLAVISARGIVFPIEWPWSKFEPLETVDNFSIDRYLGHWYEIASIPYYWERGCNCSQVEYSYNYDGTIKVMNLCEYNSTYTNITRVEGTAWITDKPSKLEVEYNFPITSRHWILYCDPNYAYVLVGEPSRSRLWIYSRYPALDRRIIHNLVTFASYRGFPVEKLEMTNQTCGWLS
mmetsp:Transcript_11686/g.13474  ORF Transcript_11686/g.13474 Transcript_11686/m.13474 type:complete len:185 (+) Transcript_11686:35-589(+)